MRRALLLLLLLFCAGAARGVTRMYVHATNLPDHYPAPSGTWNTTTEVKYRALLTSVEPQTGAYFHGTEEAFANATDLSGLTLDYSYLTPPVASGSVSTSTTVKMVIFAAELATSDDVDRCILGIRVMNQAATSTVATLLAVANYGPTAEFVNQTGTQNARNKQCADGDTLTSGHTFSAGERLLVEFGYQNSSGAGTTPLARMRPITGAGSGSDCAENESGTTACRSWIELSDDITFSASDRVGHTFYLNSQKAPPGVTLLSADAGWETTAGAIERRLDATISGSQVFAAGGATMADNAAANDGLAVRYVSAPMAAGIVFDDAVVRLSLFSGLGESNLDDNIQDCSVGLRIISQDGTTQRAVLLAVGKYGFNSVEATINRGATRTCLMHQPITADYTTVAGDRLLLEMGCGTASTATSPQCFISSGDNGRIHVSGGLLRADCRLGSEIQSAVEISCTPWFDIHGIQWAALDDTGPTRVYFDVNTGGNPLSPTVHASWGVSDELQRGLLHFTNEGTGLSIGQTVDSSAGVSEIDRQYVSLPLKVGTTFVAGLTTVEGVAMVREFNALDDMRYIVSAVRVVSSGAAVQAELLPAEGHFHSQGTGISPEISAAGLGTWTIMAPNTPVRVSYTSVSGDALVIELGAFPDASATTPQFALSYGETGSDCDNPLGFNPSASNCVGWVEFSNLIEGVSDSRNPVVIH